MIGRLRRAAGRSGGSSIPAWEALAANGDHLGAIDAISDAIHRDPSVDLERRLIQLRHEAFSSLEPPANPTPWPPTYTDRFAVGERLPEVTRDGFDADAVRSGVLAHGSLVVRGLIPSPDVERLVHDIDATFEAFDAAAAGSEMPDSEEWFSPFQTRPGYEPILRNAIRASGGVLVVESPHSFVDLFDCLRSNGVGEVVESYLGERPAIAAKKLTLRRMSQGMAMRPGDTEQPDWHQDGAFLGESVRSLNVWIALSHCGVDAPGLDIVNRRFEHVVPTGTDGARFDWSVGPARAEREAEGAAMVRTVFAPGDAVLFDHLCLHRTAMSDRMTKPRYAIESWFFAPSAYPAHEMPVVF